MNNQPKPPHGDLPQEAAHDPNQAIPHHQQTTSYGGGHIEARHGRINGWLLVVYLILFVWSLYYGYTYWGGLGPGLDLNLGGIP